MGSNFLSPLTMYTFLLLPFFFFFISPSLAKYFSKDTNIPRKTICFSTPDPAYCNYILYNQTTTNAYGYSRFAFQKSWIQSQKFYRLVDKYLKKHQSSPTPVIRALEDCLLLAKFNLDFLQISSQVVSNAAETLSDMKAESIQTFLSAILTNQQTCLEGILTTASAPSINPMKNDLMVPIANDAKLNSVSLALFTEAYVPKKRRESTWQPTPIHLAFRNGRLPPKMSGQTKAVYESVSRRKLLQIDFNDQVLVSDIVIVSQDGSGNFTTINDAVAAAPNKNNGSTGYFLIYITAGVYEEYVSISKNKKYLMMVGDGINQTIVTGNRSVVDGWTTFNSATFAVVASNFVAVNMTFRNTAGAIKHQAVAVRNGADLSTFYSCSFEGYQDTLYAHSLRQFYRECDIYGTVDFIFGNAAVVFQNCNLYPRRPMDNQFNAITAQGRTDPNQNTGTSIINCDIRAADDLASSNATFRTYLGRPWKQYSRTVYLQSFIDSLIDPAGWMAWSGDFALSTLFYGEFGNTGPGSDAASRVNWPGYYVLNATDAAKFNVANFLLGDNWLPATGVPFASVLT